MHLPGRSDRLSPVRYARAHSEYADRCRYNQEKRRVADAVISVLQKSSPEIRQTVEVIDVSTPATVIRHTGNSKGSMEGWLMTPGTGFKPLRNKLPPLQRFPMIGQWVMPGGGLPSGLITARSAIRTIWRDDRVPFTPAGIVEGRSEAA
jgi:phytoene dehydrogenase-like protein